MPRLMLRPSPVPSPAGLVVKNGRKSRSTTSAGILRPGVLDTNLVGEGVLAHQDPHPPIGALRGRIARVAEQVHEHLGQLDGAPARPRRRVDLARDGDVRRAEARPAEDERVFHEGAELELLEGLRAGQPRELPETADDLRRALGRLLDGGERLVHVGRVAARDRVAKLVGEAADDGERVVDLVRDLRRHLADERELRRVVCLVPLLFDARQQRPLLRQVLDD